MGGELIFVCADLWRDKISSLLLTEAARELRFAGVAENGWRLAGAAGNGSRGAGTMKTESQANGLGTRGERTEHYRPG